MIVSNGSCSSGASYTIFVNPLPSVSAIASPPSVCPGDTVTLSATSATATGYMWFPGSLPGPAVNVVPAGSQTYSVAVIDANSCSNFTTVDITLNTISVNAGADFTICPGFTATLNATVSGNISNVNYWWAPGQFLNDSTVQNPSAIPDTTTLFIVNVTNGSCSAKDSIWIYTVRTPACNIHIYNGITPNGDNDNDSWYIDGIQGSPENKVIIFNRWGTRIWWAKGYDNKKVIWRGTDQQGNILPDATYYYFVELYNGEGGTTFKQSGWVEVTH
ncbi:MAG: gliding motility-associated C-terminal domain-containing protein [Bacteroidetes bacterium]|nr:MAG: gliding motility-associated C-terminal domain-containing protein [Bacteroidota bacterium]